MTYLSEYKIMFKPTPTRSQKLIDLIGIASNEYNGYKTLLKSKVDGLSPVALLESYLYENTHIKTTELREARYGEYYILTASKKLGITNLMKAVKEFIYEVTYGYPDLPFVVLYKEEGTRYLLHIWISDREWSSQVKVYDRDYWYYKDTGKPAPANDSNAIRKCVKGEPKLDKNGNKIILKWSPLKSLIFNESYKDTLPRYYDIFEAILIRIKNTVKNWFLFNKKKQTKLNRIYVKKHQNRDKTQQYREIASLQYYIQQMCYDTVLKLFDYEAWERDKALGLTLGNIDITEPYGSKAQAVVKLFYKYRNRIRKGSFHDDLKHEYSLFKEVSYKKGHYNAQYLRRLFKRELEQLLGG